MRLYGGWQWQTLAALVCGRLGCNEGKVVKKKKKTLPKTQICLPTRPVSFCRTLIVLAKRKVHVFLAISAAQKAKAVAHSRHNAALALRRNLEARSTLALRRRLASIVESIVAPHVAFLVSLVAASASSRVKAYVNESRRHAHITRRRRRRTTATGLIKATTAFVALRALVVVAPSRASTR